MTPETDRGRPSGGRPIELVPVPPGFWMIVVGCVVAALAPLFGFLGGSMIGSGTGTGELDPIYLLLFAGIVIGGLGVGLAILGVRRLIAHRRTTSTRS
jgi:hypothetical protein